MQSVYSTAPAYWARLLLNWWNSNFNQSKNIFTFQYSWYISILYCTLYRGITLTSIAAKIYNALLRNRIEPKIDNILRKNQNGFRRNRSTTSQILTIRRILEGVRAKNLQTTLIFLTLPRLSIPFTEERWNKSY